MFEIFGISLEGEFFKKLLSHDEYYDWTLHRMRYQKIGGHWSRKLSGQERQERPESPQRVEPSSPPKALDVAPGHSAILALSSMIPGTPRYFIRLDD